MSKPIFVGCWFPTEQAIEESGARRIAYAFEAANDKQARAKATLLFMEEFPDADDTAFELKVYADAVGQARPAPGVWDDKFLYEYEWDETNGYPGAAFKEKAPEKVDFEKLSSPTRLSILVKYRTREIFSNQLPAAIELTQNDESTFEGHIVEAISKMPAVAAMYPDRIIEAIDYIYEKCSPTKKWPEIKAVLAGWLKLHEQERKDGGGENDTTINVKPGSGDPDRFDLVLALLVMGINPEKAGATDVKNAKHIKESRDPAWRGWRTTLIGIPGIYSFPESLLYELTLNGMKKLSLIKNSEGRQTYVREHFAGHPLLPEYPAEINNDEAEQESQNTASSLANEQTAADSVEQDKSGAQITTGSLEDESSVAERRGPFYWRSAEGDKIGRANKLHTLEAVISDHGYIEITQEEHQARKIGTWNDQSSQNEQTSSEQPAVTNHGDGRFSIEGLVADKTHPPEPRKTDSPPDEVEKAEVVQAQSESSVFLSIGAALEKDLAEKGDNLKIWRSVMRTDPRYTKDLVGAGFEGTSINAEYMIMRATEIFGPIGTGWGFEVLEDRMIPGAPMSEAIYEDKKFIGNRMLRDGDGSLITELNHSIKIDFWYLTETGAAERFEAYGATPYMYKTKSGIRCDGEAQKKSLTDAIKKALSLLGFSADVWLGLYDQAEYKQENAIEFEIRNASDKAEDVTRIRKELDEKFKLNTESMRSAVTPNEISGIASSLTRVMGVHLKAAREKGDLEYTKYLEGRLRRLEEVKTECITNLQEQAA
jgi:hypothetical protein